MILLLLKLVAFLGIGLAVPVEPRIFQNCHRQFTHHLPSGDDPLLRKVQEGEISAVDACMQLLSDFHLSPEGNLLPSEGGRAVAVLNTFHDLHASWFTKNDYFYYANECQLQSMREIQDVTAPALYFDFALFDDKNKDLGYVADSRDGLFPLRSQAENPGAFFSNHQEMLAFGKGTEVFGRKFFGFGGQLMGIAKEGPDVRIKEAIPFEKGGPPAKNIPLYRSLGPGFAGHPSYALRSGLRPPGMFPTKGSPAFRLGKELIHDLLCVEAPMLDEKDVRPLVDERSTLPFKRHASCMACHATIYPLATTFRNFVITNTGPHCLKGADQNIFAVYRFPEAKAKNGEEIPFHRSKPEGKLYFRDYRGELVSLPHGSPEEMAAAVKKTPQFYYCSARRYFEFLTGIDADTGPGKSGAAANFLHKLTEEYGKHRKPKKLIESILKSEFYR